MIDRLPLPEQIREGWGLTHNGKNATAFYITDGSNVVYECDQTQGFKVYKQHVVGSADQLQRRAA